MLKYYSAIDVSIDWEKDNWSQEDFVIFLDKADRLFFRETQKKQHTLGYCQAVNSFWADFSLRNLDKVWNGRVISINKLVKSYNKITLFYCFTEYKDILFKKQMGIAYLRQNFPLDIENHSFTAILPIIGEEYVWGIVGNGTVQEENLIDMIGGSLDYQTNFNFKDLINKTLEEMLEELNLKICENLISLYSINYFQGCLFFLFTTKIDKLTLNTIQPDTSEIKQILTSKPENLLIKNFKLTKDVKFILSYL